MAHCCLKHMPGSAACYIRHDCRCVPCSKAQHVQWKTRTHYGSPRIPAEPARKHIEHLLVTMGRSEISRLSGIHGTNLAHLIAGTQATLRRDKMQALLAIKPPSMREQLLGEVDGCGSVRRIRALMHAGWWPGEIARRSGIPIAQVLRLANGQARVFAKTRTLVDAAYESLWNQTPPTPRSHLDTRARNRARAEGWSPALAWDDDMGPHGIDNPAATPIGAGWVKPRNVSANVIELATNGEVLTAIQSRLQLTRSGVYRALVNEKRLDLWPKIMREMVA